MIKFFRKIRQNLLNEGKTSRYFKYAIGEIILVVIGILIALQINTWNIERNNSLQERKILKQLLVEYNENLKEINNKIFLRDGMIASIDKLFYHMDNGYNLEQLDSIQANIDLTFTTPTFNKSSGVTDELLNSGKLYLIENDSLKNHLTNFSTYISYVVEEEQFLLDYVLRYYYQYMAHNYRARQMWKSQLNTPYWNTFLSTKTSEESEYRIIGTQNPDSYKKYLSDPITENYLLDIRTYCKNGNYQGHGLADKINEVIAIIESELNKK
jgi:hypothetical protein